MTSPPPAAEVYGTYAFDNSSPVAADQLSCLQSYLDPLTIASLEPASLPPGARCLEIGAGGGSIARWLAERVAPDGQVLAVDLDVNHLSAAGNLTVAEHDIRDGLPSGGPWDLIHARLVLLHQPDRRQLLAQLAGALNPGGWMVIGEFSREPLRVLTSPSPPDADLFSRVVTAIAEILTQRHGADLDWAYQLHAEMSGRGLADLHTVEHAQSWTGGGTGCHLHYVNSIQLEQRLLETGLTAAELARFRDLVADPGFAARSWHFVCTRGRKSRHRVVS